MGVTLPPAALKTHAALVYRGVWVLQRQKTVSTGQAVPTDVPRALVFVGTVLSSRKVLEEHF